MSRLALLICGIVLLAFGCLLFVFGLAKIGINDAEWGHISRTGLPSAPDKLLWSPWQHNDGSVSPFSSFQPEQRPDSLPEFRVGRGQTMFFDYVIYQGRFVRGGVAHEFPALGPASGAVYHPLWACLTIAAGLFCLFAARFVRHPSRKVS